MPTTPPAAFPSKTTLTTRAAVTTLERVRASTANTAAATNTAHLSVTPLATGTAIPERHTDIRKFHIGIQADQSDA
jgi:hypothetical protein